MLYLAKLKHEKTMFTAILITIATQYSYLHISTLEHLLQTKQTKMMEP